MQVLDQLKAIGYEAFLEPDGTLKFVYGRTGEPDRAAVLPLFEALRHDKDKVIQYLRDQDRLCDPDELINRLDSLFDRYKASNRDLAELPGWLPQLWALGRQLDLVVKTRGDCRAVYEAIEEHFEKGIGELAEEETGII